MKYTIICLTDIPKEEVSLVSQCYQVWREVYEPILAESHEVLSSDLFYRCKLLSVISDETNVPVAFCLHNNFCMDVVGVKDHSYFAPATQDFMQKIISEKQHIMTLEWVTVHPGHRGKFTKIQPVDLVMGLAAKLGQASPFTAMMGFSRVDMKADRVAEKAGFRSFGEVTRHDITCRIMFTTMKDATANPLGKVQAVIEELWSQKRNHSYLIQELNDFSKSMMKEVA